MNKILRSVLFTPAERSKALSKSLCLKADAVIMDLEDATSPNNKSTARDNVYNILNEDVKTKKPSIIVRVNCPFTTPWGKDDLKMLQDINPNNYSAILLPKCETSEAIDDIVNGYNINSNKTKIWSMIETAVGVIESDKIASNQHLECLVFGANDYTKDIKARHTLSREPLLYSMSKCILSARAFNKYVIDGVHMELGDEEGLIQSCKQGLCLGFDGKSLIHPNQIEPTNKEFSPTMNEIINAIKIVEAFEKAESENKGVTVVDDRLIEKLHVEAAEILLQKAKQMELI